MCGVRLLAQVTDLVNPVPTEQGPKKMYRQKEGIPYIQESNIQLNWNPTRAMNLYTMESTQTGLLTVCRMNILICIGPIYSPLSPFLPVDHNNKNPRHVGNTSFAAPAEPCRTRLLRCFEPILRSSSSRWPWRRRVEVWCWIRSSSGVDVFLFSRNEEVTRPENEEPDV